MTSSQMKFLVVVVIALIGAAGSPAFASKVAKHHGTGAPPRIQSTTYQAYTDPGRVRQLAYVDPGRIHL